MADATLVKNKDKLGKLINIWEKAKHLLSINTKAGTISDWFKPQLEIRILREIYIYRMCQEAQLHEELLYSSPSLVGSLDENKIISAVYNYLEERDKNTHILNNPAITDYGKDLLIAVVNEYEKEYEREYEYTDLPFSTLVLPVRDAVSYYYKTYMSDYKWLKSFIEDNKERVDKMILERDSLGKQQVKEMVNTELPDESEFNKFNNYVPDTSNYTVEQKKHLRNDSDIVYKLCNNFIETLKLCDACYGLPYVDNILSERCIIKFIVNKSLEKIYIALITGEALIEPTMKIMSHYSTMADNMDCDRLYSIISGVIDKGDKYNMYELDVFDNKDWNDLLSAVKSKWEKIEKTANKFDDNIRKKVISYALSEEHKHSMSLADKVVNHLNQLMGYDAKIPDELNSLSFGGAHFPDNNDNKLTSITIACKEVAELQRKLFRDFGISYSSYGNIVMFYEEDLNESQKKIIDAVKSQVAIIE